MDEREQRMQEELAELWSATFGEQPAIEADPETMIRVLVACLKDPGPFELSDRPLRNAPTAERPPRSPAEAPGEAGLVDAIELAV